MNFRTSEKRKHGSHSVFNIKFLTSHFTLYKLGFQIEFYKYLQIINFDFLYKYVNILFFSPTNCTDYHSGNQLKYSYVLALDLNANTLRF